ncbi:iron chelate uptake ABC transporter family permease subunit [Pseudomonas sp. NPDC007930]|uniref:FecCD family ABC transporter permease n=1 Tax=Pseudomonas sp. NPDC007930 TaxID=3364417 RepID=UPI0036EAEBCD
MTAKLNLADTPPQVLDDYSRVLRRRLLLLGAFVLAIAASMLLDFTLGPAGLSLADLWQTLLHKESVSPGQQVIVWSIRLPQALMAVLVGAALGLAGAEMQTILGNPLASPFTLGVSHAAAFGAALAIVLGLGIPGVPSEWLVAANAFVFAMLATLALDVLARLRKADTNVVVLFGIALGFTFGALVSLIQFVASEDALQALVFWTLGSLARADWPKAGMLALALAVCLPLAWRRSWQLTALRLGEDRAASFGIDVKRLRLGTLLRVSVLSALAVSFVGTIGFIGLVGPHISRMLFGEDHRFYLPGSALAGAVILSLASVVSKNIIHGVLVPVGIVTALVGIPFFLFIVLRRKGVQ